MSTANDAWRSIRNSFPHTSKQQAALSAVLAAILAIAAIVILKQGTRVSSDTNASADNEETTSRVAVQLPSGKLQSVNLHTTPCAFRELCDLRTVPGKITYNEARHLEIKAPAEAVVKQVLVSQEQPVKKGERLAVLISPEVGMARDALAQCKAELKLAQNEANRAEQISKNLTDLLESLKQRPDPADIEKKFVDKILGEHRQEILSAYSKLFLADAVVENSRTLGDSGAISGLSLRERRSNREVAEATFETACEKSSFDAAQSREKRRAAVEHAQRLVAVCGQRLETLGVESDDSENVTQRDVSELVLLAPFEGIIAERWAVVSARVTAGQPLLALASTDSLWVSAEIPQRDWKALDAQQQHELMLRAPSLPEGETSARVKFTQSKISPETHTVSIVGELENRDGKFRPGMFVWVSVSMSQPQRVLAVPASAIVQHEQTKFVFIADGPNTFRRADVTTGWEAPEWVEITEGLKEGQDVVDAGTFVLKSELLLEHEAG
jgi:cobalt-zinc-cadmium efflux system membrane fusion protein